MKTQLEAHKLTKRTRRDVANAETNMQGDPATRRETPNYDKWYDGHERWQGEAESERGPDLTVPLEQELQHTLHV